MPAAAGEPFAKTNKKTAPRLVAATLFYGSLRTWTTSWFLAASSSPGSWWFALSSPNSASGA